ncbi:hypothetical protein [Candidatus Tokpelaia sp.]|nr:hypothetical protein [Candidatus Tokpelaia sp.]
MMVLMGALAEIASFSAAEIEGMTLTKMQFWAECLNLYHEEVRQQNGA